MRGCSRFSFIASTTTGADGSAFPYSRTRRSLAEANLAYVEPIPERLTDDDVLLALDRLPSDFRAIVLIVDVEEFSYREASQILSIPVGTVMSRLSRGRKLLRDQVGSGCPTLRNKNTKKGRGLAVNPTPPNKNRLKDAVNSVPLPDDLAARLRSQIHAQGLPVRVRGDRLKSAVKNVPVPASLDSRITDHLSLGPLPTMALASQAVAPVFVAAGRSRSAMDPPTNSGHLRLTKASQDAYIASVSSHMGALMRIGLRDHIHCSVFRKYPQESADG